MATIAAREDGRHACKTANLDALWLLIGFVVVVGVLDLIITGAIPKWAIFAPVFVPLLMRLDVTPEAVLAAYRVGDSPINAISPLNAYFALIVTFAQKYQKGAGVGTVVALMLPYVLIVMVLWTSSWRAWHLLGASVGPVGGPFLHATAVAATFSARSTAAGGPRAAVIESSSPSRIRLDRHRTRGWRGESPRRLRVDPTRRVMRGKLWRSPDPSCSNMPRRRVVISRSC